MTRARTHWSLLLSCSASAMLPFAACSGRSECSGPSGLCITSAGGTASKRPDAPGPSPGGDAASAGEASGGVAGGNGGEAVTAGGRAAGDTGGSASHVAGGTPDLPAPGGAGEPEPEPELECGTGDLSLTPYLRISDVFVAAGYGDPDWIELLDLAGCPERPGFAVGSCYAFEWTPYALDHVYVAWVFDRDPADDHDWWDGVCIQPGATRLTFQARSEYPGQIARFGLLADVGAEFALSDSWQSYEIDLSGVDYSHHMDEDGVSQAGMQVGFWMVLDHPELGMQRVFIDDLRLEGPVVQCMPPENLPSTCEAPVADGITNPGPLAIGTPGWCAPQLGEVLADPNASSLLIDDLEDGDEWSLPLAGGRGIWSTFNDGTPGSTQYPDCPRPTVESAQLEGGKISDFSMHTSGCGFQRFGAGVELRLRGGPPDCAAPFDASSYDGVEFWINIGHVSDKGSVTFQLNTTRTVPSEGGGSCTQGCYGNAFRDVPRSFTGGWTKVRVPFHELRQQLGPLWLLDPATILSMRWSSEVAGGATPSEAAVSFDFAVDDVRLYRQEGNGGFRP